MATATHNLSHYDPTSVPSGAGRRFALVISEWNLEITDALRRGARETLLRHGVTEADILVHDEQSPNPVLAFLLSRMHLPDFPEPIGVLRAVSRPTADEQLEQQIRQVREKKGVPELQKILDGPETWTIG